MVFIVSIKPHCDMLLIGILCNHLNFYIGGWARMVSDLNETSHILSTPSKKQKMMIFWLLRTLVAIATGLYVK